MMMKRSKSVIFQLSFTVLLMNTFITAASIAQPSSLIAEISQSTDDEQNPTGLFPNQQLNLDDMSSSKTISLTDDDNTNDDEFEHDYPQMLYYNTMWPQLINKRYAGKVIRTGNTNGNPLDTRLWAIPYRFGKRSAMPYRFGKRAGMHFRLGKKSASL